MSSYKTLPTPGDTAWFTHDRFGMFIHFGLYAMPARHEWVKNYEEIPEDHYVYERGERIPRDEVKIQIAKYFGKTVQEVFFTPVEH